MKKVWKQVKGFLKLTHKDYPYAILVLCSNSLMKATLPFFSLILSARILDILLEHNYKKAMQYVFFMVIVSFLMSIVIQYTKRSIEMYIDTMSHSLLKQVTHKATIMEYEEFEKTETLDNIRMVKNQMNMTGGAGALFDYLNQIITNLLCVVYSLSLVVYLVWTIQKQFILSLIPTLLLVLLFFLLLYYSNSITNKMSAKMVEIQNLCIHDNALGEYLFGCSFELQSKKEILLGKMETLLSSYFRKYEKSLDHYTKYGKVAGKNYGMVALAVALFSGCCYIYIGYYALQGAISVGNVVLYASTIQQFVGYLNETVSEYNAINYYIEFIDKITQFVNKPNLHYTGTLPIEKRTDNKYEFEFKNVSFKYPQSDTYVLKNINLKFEVGKKLAIVGRNGAGKTTLIKLLCRLYEPSEGEILLNGINIEKYDYDEYTTLFAPVFQDFSLFALPLDENIACSEDIDSEKLESVLEKVNIHERVNEMQDKEHTLLYKQNGDGVEVSGGEAQKIAIARALYKDAPFVILDEPTAALDPIAEAEIYENFNSLVENKTTLYISHRMSSCKFCDDIVVFREGEVVEQSNHEKLLDMNGEYASLYNAQANYYA